MQYRYIKLDEDGQKKYCPINDYDGSISGTGHCIIGLKMWFDENPEERKRFGWIKHYYYDDPKELKADLPDYDPAIHYLTCSMEQVDEWTVRDRYHIIEKTDEMLEMEEMLEVMNLYVPNGTMILDSQGGAIL